MGPMAGGVVGVSNAGGGGVNKQGSEVRGGIESL